MQMWEYDVYPWPGHWGGTQGEAGIRNMLVAKGDEGWELVTVTASDVWVFKRHKAATV